MESIRKECHETGKLWEDPDFPATDESLFFTRRPARRFVWKRPHEIVANPEMFVGGASRFDINQGMLGDCWLLAAMATLAGKEKLLYRVVPPDQSFHSPDYCGAFRFNFWQAGEWVEVIVDDRLPTYNNKLVFLHSATKNEFWSALLEKAYAKLCGSYESLKGGQTAEGMEDFTGGLAETFNLQKPPANLFQIMQRAMQRESLMCCSIEAKPNQIEAKLNNGLVKGLAYSVTGVRTVNARTRHSLVEVKLVRLRNPWGNQKEWTGPWSDRSREWTLLSDAEKQELDLTYEHDGEFWMSFDDFQKNFTRVEICNLGPESMDAIDGDRDPDQWVAQQMSDSWVRGSSAGGCRNFKNTFHKNPQFRVVLKDANDEGKSELLVALMQKDRRKMKSVGAQTLTIGFNIYKLEGDEGFAEKAPKQFFLSHASTARSEHFINSREVVGRFALDRGEYLIVPCTFEPNQEGDFLLRVFYTKDVTSTDIDEPAKTVNRKREASTASSEISQHFQALFDRLAGDDGEIDRYELAEILEQGYQKELDGGELSIEVTRTLIAAFDRDESGKLGVEEFQELLNKLREWKGVFAKYDRDRSNTMDAYELRDALNKLGLTVSNEILLKTIGKYSSKEGHIRFSEFLLCVTKLEQAFDTFTRISTDRSSDAIRCDLETWIRHML